jgi:hypothetical protein
MTRSDLQIGGGYVYQWNCAILLALRYLINDSRGSEGQLSRLIDNFLGWVEAIQLEGKKREGEYELEDINLQAGNRIVNIQVKAKEGKWWTLGDFVLRKTLYRFYRNPALDEEGSASHFVFLTNRGFNPDLSEVKETIVSGNVKQCEKVDDLYGYLQDYVRENHPEISLSQSRFYRLLQHLTFIEFWPESKIETFIKTRLQAEGVEEDQKAYQGLFTEFANRSVRKEIVTLSDLYEIVPSLFTGCLVDFIRTEPRRSVARWILEQAQEAILPPLGVTSKAVIARTEALIGDERDTLNEVEAFVLLIAICLPHLLVQYDDYTGEPLTGEMIRELGTRLGQESSAPAEISSELSILASELAAVANARTGFDLEDNEYNDSVLSNVRVRLRLLAALMRLADVLNLDQFIDPALPDFLENAPWSERYRWWRQAYVRGVSTEAQRVQLHIQLPDDREDYSSIIVNPLDDEIRGLVEAYDPILISAGINLNCLKPEVTTRNNVPSIPDEEWHRLRQQVEAEQARRSEDRLRQAPIRAQRLRESLVKAETSQAERMTEEGRHQDAAEAFARSAALLARNREAAQARHYASKAAEEYLEAGNEKSAAEQYLQSAMVWLDNAKTPEITAKHLEKAQKIAAEVQDAELQLRVLLAQAQGAFASLSDSDAKRILKQAKELFEREVKERERANLLRDIALQQSTYALVWEDWGAARDILHSALEQCPETALKARLDLLKYLLLVSTEFGDWKTTQTAYEKAKCLLDDEADPKQQSLLEIQYGVSLARQGALVEAQGIFNEALKQLEGYADIYTLSLAYQDVEYTLMRNGMMFYPDLGQHEIRRIDLFKQTQAENKGYAHQVAASIELSEQKYRGAWQHIRLALFYYWQEGAWMGLERAYQILATIRAATGMPKGALLAAIRGSDKKATEQHSKTLRDRGDAESLTEVVKILIEERPVSSEQWKATMSLSILADVIPPDLLEEVVEHLLELLRGPGDTHPQAEVRRHAAEALRSLIPQLTAEQIGEVARVALDQIERRQSWFVVEEILKLLSSCFSSASQRLDTAFYVSVTEAMISFDRGDPLNDHAERVLVNLARTAPPDVRAWVIAHLQDCSSQLQLLRRMAYLEEPISNEDLTEVTEQILNAINPKPKISEKEGKQTTSIGIGGISPRALNVFNKAFPESLHDCVIDGLLEAIVNKHNFLATRCDAVWALSDLPTNVLVGRADEISDFLLWGAEGDLPRSSIVDMGVKSQSDPFSAFRMNAGNVEQLRRSSLHALGRIYPYADEKHRDEINARLIEASRDASPVVREGVAMALSSIEQGPALSKRLLLALVVLLHDPAPGPCSWACRASGHIVSCDLADEFAEDFVERLLSLAKTADTADVRVGTAVGLQLLTSGEGLSEPHRKRVFKALNALSDDVSFRVRRKATEAA